LPIDRFRLNRGLFEYTCRECQDTRDRLRKRDIVKNNADENTGICPEKHKDGNPIHVLKRKIPKPCARGTMWISYFTSEELLRKQIWYDEPKLFAHKYRWVEPITVLIKRLIKTSNVDKVYNYKTSQIKRSKETKVRKTLPYDTYKKLKDIHDELKITYDEIIWRLIKNDKTTKKWLKNNSKFSLWE
jgi:hypothetical protein